MKRKLYANTKRLATTFCICIGVVTVVLLALRLSLFRDMVSTPDADIQTVSGEWLEYSLNGEVYFASASAQGNVLIESDSANTCLMSVAIIYPETRDTLIYTGLMEPGEVKETAPLDQVVGEGVYACTAEISAYDSDTREFLGKDTRTVTLYVGTFGDDQG